MARHDEKLKNLSYLVEDRAGSIVERLTEKLRTLILTGELPEGYVFPNEMVLCEYLRVGRSTLRETYKELASFGLISRSKRGTVVNSSDVIAANMPYHMLIKTADFRDLLEFRVLVEKDTARIAAVRANAENKRRLAECLEKMKQSVGDANLLTMYDTMFHLEIARATGNLLISRDAWQHDRRLYAGGIFQLHQRHGRQGAGAALSRGYIAGDRRQGRRAGA